MSDDEAINAVGWDAIDAALEPIYHGREPKHYGVYIPDPLPHFHFVTYGFSELYEKESEDPEVSGYGFELTFRLACSPDDEEPPVWVLNFPQNLARHVFSTGNPFAVHHHMNRS